jgi:hypothetical protein
LVATYSLIWPMKRIVLISIKMVRILIRNFPMVLN